MSLQIRVLLRGNGNQSPEHIIATLRANWLMTALRPGALANNAQKIANVDPDNSPLFLAIATAIRFIPLMWPERNHTLLLEFAWGDPKNSDTYKFVWSSNGGKDWHCLLTAIKSYETKKNLELLAQRLSGKEAEGSVATLPMA